MRQMDLVAGSPKRKHTHGERTREFFCAAADSKCLRWSLGLMPSRKPDRSSAYGDDEVGACGATGDGDIMMRFLPW